MVLSSSSSSSSITLSLLLLGNNKTLEIEDLWLLDNDKLMYHSSETFDQYFNNELHHNTNNTTTTTTLISNKSNTSNLLIEFWKSPLTRAIVMMYRAPLIYSGLLKFLNTAVQFLPSLIVARILYFVDNVTITKTVSSSLSLSSLSSLSLSSLSSLINNGNILYKGYWLSLLLFISLCIKTFIENQYFHVVTTMGATIRGVIASAVYRKSLKLSPAGRQNNTVGQIVNYMQLDASRIEYVASSIHVVWDGLFQVFGYTALLLNFLGPAVLAGIAAMLIIIPVNTYFLKKLSTLRAANSKLTDSRVKLTTEILQGVRAIKAYNWEQPFIDKLTELRDKEMKSLTASANTRAILISVLSTAPSLVAVVTLALYAFLGNALTPTKVFTALALFNQLRFPLIFFPMLLNTLAEGKVSLNRLTDFLLSDEIEEYVQRNEFSKDNDVINIHQGNFSWSSSNVEGSQNRGGLINTNINVKKGELVAVVGPVGSGKSTLLSALLGELHKESGSVSVDGRVAYVPQAAWIPNESLRNVVLFGKSYNERKFRSTIRVCGLEKDLQLLDNGDQTEIGERGVNLSGGQKQRVSIARAVYDEADIYLFDDPLSALDAEVGAKLFQECIKSSLKDKTRILVTHQLNVLPEVDRIIIMGKDENSNANKIVDQGTLYELLSRGHDLSKLVREKQQQQVENEEIHPDTVIVPNNAIERKASNSTEEHVPILDQGKSEEKPNIDVSILLNGEIENMMVGNASAIVDIVEIVPTGGLVDNCGSNVDCLLEEGHSSQSEDKLLHLTESEKEDTPMKSVTSSHSVSPEKTINEEPVEVSSTRKLMTVEERAEGAVNLSVYQAYIKAASNPTLLFLIMVSFTFANASQILQQWVVAAWTSDAGYVKRPLAVYLGGVSFMAACVAFFNWSRTYIQCLLGAAASRKLHKDMTRQVLMAPLSYFESTPIGRLIQRFSKDLDQIDQQLPGSFAQLISSSLSIAGSMVAVSIVTPSFGFVMIPIFAIYFRITNYYRNVARELKRLDSISRSPIFSHFTETLGGLSVIRSFTRQKMFKTTNELKIDDNVAAYFSLKIVDRWLSVRLELLGNCVVFFSALLAVISGSRAGAAGLSLNNALSVTSLLNWAVRNGAETESLMNSVERVFYTTSQTPSEAASVVDSISSDAYRFMASKNNPNMIVPSSDAELLSSGWPWKGGITFTDVQMRYRSDFEPVLRGVDLHIAPGESVGIVGRTGSGKSSLFRCLLRLTELESGSICIDGVDISAIGLQALRSSISIIPQDPELFSGSIRLNLDPFTQYSDEALWTVLKKSKLDKLVASLPGGLDFIVSEGGENFSIGQRQLLTLGKLSCYYH